MWTRPLANEQAECGIYMEFMIFTSLKKTIQHRRFNMNEPLAHHVKQKIQAQKTKEVRAQGEAERQCDTWDQHSFLPLKKWGKALRQF